MMTAVLLWCLASQQERTVQRTEKADYYVAKKRCEEGEGIIDSDPKGAIEKLDEVINNPKVRIIEVRLRIEERPSEYTAWYPFLPYQYRARAKMKLAQKADLEVAAKLLTEAVADLQRSTKEGVVEGNLKEGVKSSEDFLKTAKSDLEAVQAKIRAAAVKTTEPGLPEPAIVKFRPAFLRLLDDSKFKTARDSVDTAGKELTDPEKKKFREDAEAACRSYLDEQALRFRRRLSSDVRSLGDLQSLNARFLETVFAVPKADELLVLHPALEWGRTWLPFFEAVRSRKAPAETLLSAASQAVPLEPDGENPWFDASEAIAFEGMRDAAQASMARARDAVLADRGKERTQTEILVKRWSEFESGLDAKFREGHPTVAAHGKEITRMMAGFPVDLAELDRTDLDACFAAPVPEEALGKLEQSLKGLESGKTVTRESRRKLYHLLFTTTALKALCEGKSEEEAAERASGYGEKLMAAGGVLDTKKYGPRMEAVYAKLR